MKNKLKLIFAILSGHTVLEAYTPKELDHILDAISAVESGQFDFAVGENGERSRYQIKSYTWCSYTKACFITESAYPDVSKEVALAHVKWIIANLNKNNIRPTVHRIALCWNMGLYGGSRCKLYSNYAERVNNLFKASN